MRYVFVVAFIVIPLLVFYYILVALQCFNIVKFTKKDINSALAWVPFYYWFV